MDYRGMGSGSRVNVELGVRYWIDWSLFRSGRRCLLLHCHRMVIDWSLP